jgi:universal stress protein E
METPKVILVVISGRPKIQEALERAILFATSEDVHINILSVVYEPITDLGDVLSLKQSEDMKRQYMDDRYQLLYSTAEKLIEKGIKCSVNVLWHHELHEAIEIEERRLNTDLVIKHISADANNQNPFAMPVDRHLLRYCPAPLLLVRNAYWRKGPITLAIDPSASDAAHIQLNSRILKYGKMLGQLTNNDIHVVASFEVPSISPEITMQGVDYEVVHHDAFKMIHKRLRLLVIPYNIHSDNIHLIEGKPERAIAKFVNEKASQLLILGTVGRTGLTAAFIGNTAERILAELSCEILALKPLSKIG